MKAILVTQELKDNNTAFFSNNNVGTIVIKTIPDTFNGAENINAGGYKNRTDLQALDGWKDVINPSYNTQTQKLGSLIDGGDVYTYEVIDLTAQEIEQRLRSESEANKQQLVQSKLETQVTTEAQLADDELALEQKDLYPFWSADSVTYPIDFKVLDFTADNELALYKVVQGHTSQSGWNPKDVPALFTRVQLDVVLDWIQPTGAQDAYNIGDRVIFPSGSGTVYESTVNANVFAPLVVAGQWILV